MALDWIPIYPDRFERHLLRPLGQDFRLILSPIPNPAPPTDYPFPPTYPDQVYARRLLPYRIAGMVAPIVDFTWFAPIPWWPIYPTRLSRRSLPTSLQQTTAPFQISAIRNVAVFGAWRPILPVQLPRPIARYTPGTLTAYVLATPDHGRTFCVELDSEVLVAPTITAEALTASELLTEGLQQGTMTAEGLCLNLTEDQGILSTLLMDPTRWQPVQQPSDPLRRRRRGVDTVIVRPLN